jgi:hypothetical protein
MANIDQIIEDLIKGAKQAGAQVELRGSLGRETKLASNYGGLGGSVGSLIGGRMGVPLAGGMAGAAMGADPGMGMRAAGGSLIGGGIGGLAGAGLSTLVGHPELAGYIQALTQMGGSALGGHYGGQNPALHEAAEEGTKAAFDRFGVKHAFLGALAGMAGSLAGPSLARGALGKIAPTVAKGLGQGMKGMAFDTAASMGGQALGNRLS